MSNTKKKTKKDKKSLSKTKKQETSTKTKLSSSKTTKTSPTKTTKTKTATPRKYVRRVDLKDCNQCQGITNSGNICTRKASCKLGCKYVCWQHASYYEPGKICQMNYIKPCKKSSLKQNRMPCRKNDKIYWTRKMYEDDFESYLDASSSSSSADSSPSKYKKCNYDNPTFPCSLRSTIFRNQNEWDEYIKIKTEGLFDKDKDYRKVRKINKMKHEGPYDREDRDDIAELANKKLKKEKKLYEKKQNKKKPKDIVYTKKTTIKFMSPTKIDDIKSPNKTSLSKKQKRPRIKSILKI